MDAMELINAFDAAFAEWDRLVHKVTPQHWTRPTPCTEWDVHDLLNHLVSEHLWAPHLLRGATLSEVGTRFDGDVTGRDPVGAWERAASESYAAFHQPRALRGKVHVTGGQTSARDYAWQMTTDLAVHGWDLARGLDTPSRMRDELADAVYTQMAPQADSWQGIGVFGPPVPVADDARPQDQLVALLGRQP
jgi:uncharacterized protein (TIGR03086 family)